MLLLLLSDIQYQGVLSKQSKSTWIKWNVGKISKLHLHVNCYQCGANANYFQILQWLIIYLRHTSFFHVTFFFSKSSTYIYFSNGWNNLDKKGPLYWWDVTTALLHLMCIGQCFKTGSLFEMCFYLTPYSFSDFCRLFLDLQP